MSIIPLSEAPFEFFGDVYLWKEVFEKNSKRTPNIKDYVSDLLTCSVNIVETAMHNAKYAFRSTTFTYSKFCYICNKYRGEIMETYMDSFVGKYLRYGWLHCKECRPFAIENKIKRELNLGVLPLSTYEDMSEENFTFLLKNEDKLEYITSANFSLGFKDAILIHYRKKILTASLYWFLDDNITEGNAEIPFANLIFHNRKYFGYNYYFAVNNILKKSQYFQNTTWKNKWVQKFKEEYVKANAWEEYSKISARKKIPKDINFIMLNYLGYFNFKDYDID